MTNKFNNIFPYLKCKRDSETYDLSQSKQKEQEGKKKKNFDSW